MSSEVTCEVAAELARLAAQLRRRGQPAEVVARALIGRVFGCFADALGVAAEWGSTSSPSPSPESFSTLPEWQALARLRWVEVDPVIFGALLEEALESAERRRLGAHFTPRADVELLIRLAVEEPLRADWDCVQAEAAAATQAGDGVLARRIVREFLAEIAAVRVLDPACGTGNFLIVAYELLKDLEAEVIARLGEPAEDLPRVSLAQLVGLECKQWACEIAGLGLWIAAVRWHVRRHGAAPMRVLAERAEIHEQDALLGGAAPASWPAATFIVGNPPFLGKSVLKICLGEGYTRRLRAAYPGVPESVDLVMYWWYRAAVLVRDGAVRRFGLVTTNSVAQILNRRVVEGFLRGDPPLYVRCAIADCPWAGGPRGAGVRIAMTVVEAGSGDGRRLAGLVGGGFAEERGVIGADLRIGVDVASAARLAANRGLAGAGVMLGGRGFLLLPGDGLSDAGGAFVRPIVHGRDVLQGSRRARVIDFSGLDEVEARRVAPEVFARLEAVVRPQRADNPRAARRQRYWQFSETMPATRRAIAGLSRYIVTPETAKHRVFCFVDGGVVPEHPLLAIGLDDAYHLAVLSSRIHGLWARATGGTLEDRPRYNKSVCFEMFPFPVCEGALRAEIAELGERLERCRQGLLAEGWTVTKMYSERVPALQAVHAELDRAVGAAYAIDADAPERAVLAELLALNQRRAAEERAGTVRWLRPAWQSCPQG